LIQKDIDVETSTFFLLMIPQHILFLLSRQDKKDLLAKDNVNSFS
jgi:hypothetical protein